METCMKVLLVIVNVILLVFAIIMIGVGIWIVVEFPAFNRVLDNSIISSSVWITMVVGIVLIIICLLAFCGAASSNQTILGVYVTLQIALFILEATAAGFIFYVGTESVHGYLANEANSTLVQYGSDEKTTTSWDTLNKQIECCGVTGPEDFQYTPWYQEFGDTYSFPDSCCALSDGDIADRTKCHTSVEGFYFADGCLSSLEAFVEDNFYVAAGVAVTVTLIQILAIISACAVGCLQ